MCFGLEDLRFLIAQTPVPGRGLRAPSLFGRFPWSDFLFPCPPAASALPWRRLVYSSPENLFHELSTPFCVRNTSQTRNFENCLRLKGDLRTSASMDASARRRLGPEAPAAASSPAGSGPRWQSCALSCRSRGTVAGSSAHHWPAAPGRCRCARNRRGTGGDGTLAHPIDGARAALRTCGSRATWLVSCLQLPCYSPACCSCPC